MLCNIVTSKRHQIMIEEKHRYPFRTEQHKFNRLRTYAEYQGLSINQFIEFAVKDRIEEIGEIDYKPKRKNRKQS